MKILYKAYASDSNEGIEVDFGEWRCIHETKRFWFCVSRYYQADWYTRLPNETELQLFKRVKVPIKKVHKESSRFAFETKEKAYKHLLFIKRKQIGHLERNLEMLKRFVEKSASLDLADLNCTDRPCFVVPDSKGPLRFMDY